MFVGIAILVETLHAAVETICHYKAKRCKKPAMASFLPQTFSCRFYDDYDRARPLLDGMESNGWCQRELFCLDGGPQTLPISSLHFYAQMEPSRKGFSHKKCSPASCRHEANVDEDNYEVMHLEDDCNCALIGPSLSKMKEIFEAGDFPVVSLTASNEIEVQRGSQVKEFVALSHVWSDGHGNPNDNTLPTCFLKLLSTLISNALGTGEFPLNVRSYSDVPGMLSRNLKPYKKPDWFWMDTLCIPRQPYRLRSKAIQGMREPFAKATVVLVTDNRLTHVKTKNMSDIEMYARLKMSNWAKRLWTFHEDAVGAYHYIQFGDRSVDLLRQSIPLALSLQQIRDKTVSGEISVPKFFSSSLSTAFSSSKLSGSIGDCSQAKVATLQRYGLETRGKLEAGLHWYRSVLKTKTTTRDSDQALCLASLMKLDLKKITDASTEEKMKVFWSLVPRIPIGIIFSKSKAKLNFDGYRWAPTSFLEFRDKWKKTDEWLGPLRLHQQYVPRTAGDRGQEVMLSVLHLQASNGNQQDEGLGKETMESLLNLIKGTGHKARFFDHESIGWNIEFESDWHTEQRCFDRSDGLAIVIPSTSVPAGKTWQGLLVSYKQNGDCLEARAHRHVKLKRISTPLPLLDKGFDHCMQIMRSSYENDVLRDILFDSEKSDSPEKVEEAEKYLHELLKQQESFEEEDSQYWQEYHKSSAEYIGKKAKKTERSDTVVMWSLLWPRIRARLSEKKMCVCID